MHELRHEPTAAERRLWQHLRRGQLAGLTFRRQHAVGPYIVDFYQAAAQLVIEVDGPIHLQQVDADRDRQEYLERAGLRVVRFTNDEVLGDVAAVLRRIEAAARATPPPDPLPASGEGGSGIEQAASTPVDACSSLPDSPSPLAGRGSGGGVARAATYTLHHRADSPTGLTPLTDFEVLRRFTADGDYRPLPTAPTLRRGWIARGLSEDDVVAALETLYPATIAAWAAERDGRLEPVSWGAVARRQTGQQGLVKRLAPELARDAVACHCAPERCLRRIVWDLAEDEPLGLPRGDGPVPCYEPCSLLVAFLRGVVGWQRGEGAGGGPVWAEFLARQGITEPVAQAAEDDDE